MPPSPGLHVLAGEPGVPELVPVHEAALLPGQQPPPPQQHHPRPAHQPRLRHRGPDGAGPLRALGVPVTCHVSRVTVSRVPPLQPHAVVRGVDLVGEVLLILGLVHQTQRVPGHSTQYTVHSTQYTVHSTQYTQHSTQ